jgi:hypothetical protein
MVYRIVKFRDYFLTCPIDIPPSRFSNHYVLPSPSLAARVEKEGPNFEPRFRGGAKATF